MSDTYLEILRRLTPAEKLATAQRLRETAWELTAAGVRLREPHFTEQQVQDRVREIFHRAGS